MLTRKQIEKILPNYKKRSYKGIQTGVGVWVLTKSRDKYLEMEVDLKEAMRETGRNYVVLRRWNDEFMKHIKYEVLE